MPEVTLPGIFAELPAVAVNGWQTTYSLLTERATSPAPTVTTPDDPAPHYYGPHSLTTQSQFISVNHRNLVKGPAKAVQQEIERAALDLKVMVNHSLLKQLWTNLDREISTDRVDYSTGVALPQCDSVVLDFQGQLVSSPVIATYLSLAMRNLRLDANRMGLPDVQWKIAMVTPIWLELSRSWTRSLLPMTPEHPWICDYCGTENSADLWKCWDGIMGCGGSRPPITGWVCLYCGRTYPDSELICWDGVDGCGAIGALIKVADVPGLRGVLEHQSDLLTWMLKEDKIIIDGFLCDVIVDDYVPQHSLNPYELLSNIYFIPAHENIPLARREYVRAEEAHFMKGDSFQENNSMFSWCVYQDWQNDTALELGTTQRIALYAPQLAGKITNVLWDANRLCN